MNTLSEKIKAVSKRFLEWCQAKKWRYGLVAFLLASIVFFLFSFGKRPGAKVYVDIEPGMNTEQVASLLQKDGIIGSQLYFRLLAKADGLDKSIKAGRYILYKDMATSGAITLLKKGPSSAQMRITIPEGYMVVQIAAILAKRGIVSQSAFLAAAKGYAPYPYMQTANPHVKYKAEGFLFPDTYDFMTNSQPEKIMQTMTAQFNKEFTPALRERAKEQGLTIREVVILASLVEAEAKYPEDRPIIAQVFFNRLKINMPLQSDTTIQYVLSERKEELSLQDTKIESPYNTYIHYGLPPGAVDNPGMASIKAVLYPEANDYLYFVADSSGHNHYSRTYSEHLEVLSKIQ